MVCRKNWPSQWKLEQSMCTLCRGKIFFETNTMSCQCQKCSHTTHGGFNEGSQSDSRALMQIWATLVLFGYFCATNSHYFEVIYVTYHWGKSGAVHCPMFSGPILSPCFPHAPHIVSATWSLTLMASSLVELKDSWRLEGQLIPTVLSETTTFTLFWEKVVWVIALPFICEHRLNTL